MYSTELTFHFPLCKKGNFNQFFKSNKQVTLSNISLVFWPLIHLMTRFKHLICYLIDNSIIKCIQHTWQSNFTNYYYFYWLHSYPNIHFVFSQFFNLIILFINSFILFDYLNEYILFHILAMYKKKINRWWNITYKYKCRYLFTSTT